MALGFTWVCGHEYKARPVMVDVCFSPSTFSWQGAGTEEVESQLDGVKKVHSSEGQEKGGQLSELLGLTDCWSNSFRGSELERQEVMGTQ